MPAPRKYPDELRERAVREVRATGRPIAHVAKDLGIHKEALRGWVRQAEADHGERDDRLTTAEHEEMRRTAARAADHPVLMARAIAVRMAAEVVAASGWRDRVVDRATHGTARKGVGVTALA